jgi:polyisoprenoid-binding protein YceI
MSIAVSEEVKGLIPSGTWRVDPAHSAVGFAVKHVMISTVRGRFGEFEGEIEANGDLDAAEFRAAIRAASIDTNQPQRDEHLRSPDFFDAETYPEIRFESKRVEHVEHDRFRIVGDLSMRGTTREVVLEGTVEGTGRDPYGNDRIALDLRGELDRKDFGLTWNQALETGGVLVGDRVKLAIDVSAIRA